MNRKKFKNALLIDDNHIDNMINKRILLNHEVAENIVCMQSAAEALEFLEGKENDKKQFPDLILLDIRMPEMDGFDFLAAFENIPSRLKTQTHIYMVSSSLDPTDQKKVIANKRVIRFFGKPLNQNHIQFIFQNQLKGLQHISG